MTPSDYPRLPTQPPYPTPIPPGGPFEKIEAEITALWGHINAATYRFLKLVAEYDAHECWAWHGCRNCAQWLNWQCGIDIGAAREKVRTARALEALPGISEAFAAGQLSYSKVRALTRIATPGNEAELLNVALHGTAAHVEKLVRRYRRVERLEEAEQAMQAHWQRSVDYFYDENGLLTLHARLPAEVGALVVKALEAAEAIVFDAQRAAAGAQAAQDGDGVSAETSDDGAEQVDRPFAARRADALLQLAEHFLSRPPEAADHISGAARYQVVVHIDQQALSEASDAVLDGASDAAPTGVPRRSELDGAPRLAVDTARRLGCDAALVGVVEADGEPLSVGRRTRSIPPAIARALAARDGGCRFPGCTERRFTEGHHVKHWANGGETKLSNLVTLCRHHHRLVHEGGFGITATDGQFLFTRPDGTRLDEQGCRTPVERFRGNAAAVSIEQLNAAQGLRIDAETCRSRWLGERLDYGLAVGWLIAQRDSARAAVGDCASREHRDSSDSRWSPDNGVLAASGC